MRSVLVGSLLLAACASAPCPAPALRVNHLQAKGTHNSYHVAPRAALSPAWRYTHDPLDVQLERHGVRQIELDVHYRPGQPFAVFHVPVVDAGSTCTTLREALATVKGWSDAHPDHLPLFVFLEPKDEHDSHKIDGHWDEIEAEILGVWPRPRILTPDDVRGDAATLAEAVRSSGWPSLAASRGKAVFVVLDEGAHRDGYARGHPSLRGRLMLVTSAIGRDDCAIVKIDDPVRREAEIVSAVRQGILVRTRADAESAEARANDRTRLAAALRSGAHLISTDWPARRDDGGYWVEIPGGTPARPNPLTAPVECTAAQLEALR